MASLSVLIKKYKDDKLSIARLSCAGVSNLTATGTPVDVGTLRDSWTPSLNSPDNSNRGGDPSGVVNNMNLGDNYYYVNGQPYGPRIEYEGHSPQAPNGMRGLAVAQWQREVDDAVRQSR